MAKLINVIKDTDKELERRQLPLVIDEKLTVSIFYVIMFENKLFSLKKSKIM